MRLVIPISTLAVVGSFVALPAAAQRSRWAVDRSGRIEVGLIGMVNRNTVTGAGPVDARIRGGGGGFLSVPVAPGLRLRPEIMVSGKQVGRSELFFPGLCPRDMLCSSGPSRTISSSTWLEVPLLMEVRFARSRRGWLTPRVYAGPFVAVRVGCSRMTSAGQVVPQGAGSGSTLVEPCDAQLPTVTSNNGDAGFVLGGGVSTRSIGISMRWTRSLVPLEPFGSNGFLAGAKNSTLALGLELVSRLR